MPVLNVDEMHVSPTALPQQPAEVTPMFTLGELIRFVSIVATILLLANVIVCSTWSYFFELPGWVAWQVLPAALAVVFIPATVLRFKHNHPILRGVYALSAAWLGFLNFAFFASVACWIVAGVYWMAGWTLPRFSIAGVMFSLALVATAYGLINAAVIRVSRVTIKLPNLPESWRGRTAALITDLHLGPLSGAKFLQRVITRLRSLKPDAVFISGDMFDGPTLGLDQLVAPWHGYSAAKGVFYVTGNHDEFAERSLYLDPAKRVGLHVLNNEKVTLDGLQLIGLHDSEAGDPTQLHQILNQVQIDRQLPSILLAHRPINLSVAEEAGISLQLSGHTHGGQIWPWNLLVSRIYGRAAHGLSRLGKLQIYTSYGVGTWGPPLRIGTNSEIVLIQFETA